MFYTPLTKLDAKNELFVPVYAGMPKTFLKLLKMTAQNHAIGMTVFHESCLTVCVMLCLFTWLCAISNKDISLLVSAVS